MDKPMRACAAIVIASSMAAGCHDERPAPPPYPPPGYAQAPMQAPLGPVAPGSYTNHVGNPAVGQWDAQGQWQWKDPNSSEASSTMNYLLAAGAGAAVGGIAARMLTKKEYEQKHPTGWSQTASTLTTTQYMSRSGQVISKEEYDRRKAQSERDKAAHKAQQQRYRDKNGRFISKEVYEKRQEQSRRDRAKARVHPRQGAKVPKSRPTRVRSSPVRVRTGRR